jgi:hypothetical protein
MQAAAPADERPGGALSAGSGGGVAMDALGGILVTFLIVVLVLFLVNALPLDRRTKQLVRVVVIILGVLSLLGYLTRF